MSEEPKPPATVDTVEALVRQQLSKALGGPRGILEAAVPTAAFTVCFVVSDDLKLSLIVAGGLAVLAFAVRVLQKGTTAYVMNAALGIGIGAVFAMRGGGDGDDRACDFFLPGILYNTAYSAVLLLTVLVGWPLVGFMVGSVTGDPTGWRNDPGMVKLCRRLTLILAVPCVLRVLVQYPLYKDCNVGALGTAKLVMGWPLWVATLFVMGAVLAKGRTPLVKKD
ncbi:MAG: DUF3159 domain-containing protein [Sporichthyaceae bacterium]